MIVDGRQIPAATTLDVDVCIVGSGPAGMTVAEQLTARGLTVVVVERGEIGTPAAPPELEFESPHFDSPVGALSFQFGGMVPSWNSWLPDGTQAARYLPLEPVDLMERWWMPHSGWPIGYDALLPYYERARSRCGLPSFDPRSGESVDPARHPLVGSGRLVTRLDQLGPADVFGPDAVPELPTAPTLTLVTNAAVTEVRPDPDGVAVQTLVRSDHSFAVRSRASVLACGAIENARLMLSSTGWHPAGLGNHADHLGRYFMDHPRIQLGHGQLSDDAIADPGRMLGLYETHQIGADVYIGKLTLSEEVLRRERVLNGNMLIAPHHLGAHELSAIRSARRVAEPLRSRRRPPHLGWHTRRVGRGGFQAGARMVDARLRPRPDLATAGSERWTDVIARSFRLNYQAEQAPNRWNRVSLTERVDALGVRVARLQWRWSSLDLASIATVRRGRRRRARRERCRPHGAARTRRPPRGRARRPSTIGPPPPGHDADRSASARDGVVDPDCQVHGVPNVFVCGGSVFPTGGHANPTLTVIALALRLADEVARRLDGAA